MFVWLVGSDEQPPILWRVRSSQTFIILTVATAIFTDIFVYGIVVPVLPFALTTRSSVRPDQIQRWISIFLAVYGAALLASAPICGWVADRTATRRLPLLLGLLALGGATVLLCVGNSIAILAAGRVLQGISAAVVWVVGLALIIDTMGGEGVGQAMGYVGLSMSLAILLAPLLGGIVFAESGYYSVFAMAFGLIVLDIFMRLVLIEKKAAIKWLQPSESEANVVETTAKNIEASAIASKDTLGLPSGVSQEHTDENLLSMELQTSEKRDQAGVARPEDNPTTTDSTGGGEKGEHRLPRLLYLLTSRRLLSALFGSMIQASTVTAFDSILPLFVRDAFHWNSLGAGLIFLPVVAASFTGPLIGTISDKYGSRWFATAGFLLVCPMVILLRLVEHDTMQQKVLLCALLALNGLGLILSITPLMAEVSYAVDVIAMRRPPGFFGDNGVYAQAYSLFNVAWAAGCMVGPLLGGLINQQYGWKVTTLVLGCVNAFTALPTAIWTGGSIFKRQRRPAETVPADHAEID